MTKPAVFHVRVRALSKDSPVVGEFDIFAKDARQARSVAQIKARLSSRTPPTIPLWALAEPSTLTFHVGDSLAPADDLGGLFLLRCAH